MRMQSDHCTSRNNSTRDDIFFFRKVKSQKLAQRFSSKEDEKEKERKNGRTDKLTPHITEHFLFIERYRTLLEL